MVNDKLLRVIAPKVLRWVADALERGEQPCELTEDETKAIYGAIADGVNNQPLSLTQAARYMHMSPSTFRAKVRLGELPKGKKDAGFKELRWYKADLKKICKKTSNFL